MTRTRIQMVHAPLKSSAHPKWCRLPRLVLFDQVANDVRIYCEVLAQLQDIAIITLKVVGNQN